MSQYPFNHHQQGYNYSRQPAQHPQQQPPHIQPQHAPQEMYDRRAQYITYQNSPPGPAPYPAPHYHQPYSAAHQPAYQPTHVTTQSSLSYPSHSSYGASAVETRSVDTFPYKIPAGPSHHMSSSAREVRQEPMPYGAAQQPLQGHAMYPGVWTDPSRHRSEPQDDTNLQKLGQQVFQDFDIDRSGYLDLHEFMEALRTARLDITYHEAIECFLRCDENEDGRITQDEFVKIFVDENKQRRSTYSQQPPPQKPPTMR